MEDMNFAELTSQISAAMPIDLNQIPDIDLYMDQVLTFLDEKLIHFKRNENEKLLTKTMINNYSKDKVLPPPMNKKYSKRHIILLILIYHMKSMLSISDITTILKTIEDDKDIEVSNLYNSFIGLQKLESSGIMVKMEENTKMANTLNPSSENEFKVLTILSLILEANTKKQLAQKMIDELS